MRVLVLCHGNINRSALAAAVLQAERPDWEIRQGALKAHNNPAWRPERAPLKMREAAAERGYSLEEHRSRAVEDADFDWADIVLFMDGGNHKRMIAIRPEPGPGKGWVNLGSYADLPRIPDPNFMRRGSPEFLEIVDLIISASLAAAKNMIAIPF
jgi:protein-tyrosine-phosphatase